MMALRKAPLFSLLFFGLFLTAGGRGAKAADMLNFARLPSLPSGPHNAEPLPAPLLGIWVWPDCKAAREILVIAPHYRLLHNSNSSDLGAIQSWRQEGVGADRLYAFRVNFGSAALMKIFSPTTMRLRMSDVHSEARLHSAWGQIDDQAAPIYTRCDGLTGDGPDLTQEDLDAVSQLDSAYTACAGVTRDSFSKASSCQNALFALADRNHDGTLDRAELARVYRQISFSYTASVNCGAINYGPDLPARSENFAKAILGKEKSIDLKTLTARLTDPELTAEKVVADALDQVQNQTVLLPFLPEAENKTACSLTNPDAARTLGTVPLPTDK